MFHGVQRRSLECIGKARGAGVLQSKMSADLGVTAASFFYVVKVHQYIFHLAPSPTVLSEVTAQTRCTFMRQLT